MLILLCMWCMYFISVPHDIPGMHGIPEGIALVLSSPPPSYLPCRKLLGQYVPRDQLADLPPLTEDRPPREEVGHLWLCYW